VRMLLAREAEEHAGEHGDGHGSGAAKKAPGIFGRAFAAFNRGFDRLRSVYGGWLGGARAHRGAVAGGFLGFGLAAGALFPVLGRDFFPAVDAGLIKLHVRGPPGTRLEESEQRFARIEESIRTVIPPHEIRTMLDNIGIPSSGINLSLSEGALISSADG